MTLHAYMDYCRDLHKETLFSLIRKLNRHKLHYFIQPYTEGSNPTYLLWNAFNPVISK